MPLPQQVINQLAREPAKTPGWSSGILLFSAGIFVIALVVYFALVLGYTPYLSGQVKNVQSQINQVAQSISPTDQTNLITLYSQISNLQSLLQNHVVFSQFLSWLSQNTEANIYYPQLTFGSGNQVLLTGSAKSESDINQQLAIFEASPIVKSVTISNATLASTGNRWTFAVTLIMAPSIFTSILSTP